MIYIRGRRSYLFHHFRYLKVVTPCCPVWCSGISSNDAITTSRLFSQLLVAAVAVAVNRSALLTMFFNVVGVLMVPRIFGGRLLNLRTHHWLYQSQLGTSQGF